MSGKRIWNGTEEEYRVLHEQEMRQRFMQTMNVWRNVSAPASALPQAMQPAWRSQLETTSGKVPPRFEEQPAAALPEPTKVITTNRRDETNLLRRFEVTEAAKVIRTVANAPALWFQHAARSLARRLERAGFRLASYDARQTAVTMRRGAEKVTIVLIKAAPISTISGANLESGGEGEWERESAVIEQTELRKE